MMNLGYKTVFVHISLTREEKNVYYSIHFMYQNLNQYFRSTRVLIHTFLSSCEPLISLHFVLKRRHRSPVAPMAFAKTFILVHGNWQKQSLLLIHYRIILSGTTYIAKLNVCLVIGRVRVANELGAGNGNAARFATIVAVSYSAVIGLFFCILILILHDKVAYIFTSSAEVLQAVDKMSYLLGITILLNSVQPVLSGEFLLLTP